MGFAGFYHGRIVLDTPAGRWLKPPGSVTQVPLRNSSTTVTAGATDTSRLRAKRRLQRFRGVEQSIGQFGIDTCPVDAILRSAGAQSPEDVSVAVADWCADRDQSGTFRTGEPELHADPEMTADDHNRGDLQSGPYVSIGGHGVLSAGDVVVDALRNAIRGPPDSPVSSEQRRSRESGG